uniref:Transmembrane protein n=1 Tax=Strongyloides papillosus TaxID=174720 RepID=A0A0N5BBG8_STREA
MLFGVLIKIFIILTFYSLSIESIEADDEACRTLKKEFEEICFSSTHSSVLLETETFCSAFRQTCAHIIDVKTLMMRTTQNKKYCKRYREVFQFVCPEPTRFGKYSNDAMSFCPRYQTRCPNEPLPSQPIEPQKKMILFSIYLIMLTDINVMAFYGLGGYGLGGYGMGGYGIGSYGMGYGGSCCMGSMYGIGGIGYGMGYGIGYGGYSGGCCGGYYG